MQNDIESNIWECLLKSAVIENSLNEIRDYPKEEIDKLVIPEQYDRKMLRLVKQSKFKDIRNTVFRYLKRMVAIIIILLGVSFAVFLQFEEVRAACKRAIIQFYEKFIQVDYMVTLSDENVDLELGYIPDGFYLAEKSVNDWRISLRYENDAGDIIDIFFSKQMHTLQLDIEHYNIEDVQIINGIQGKLFVSLDSQFNNYIIFDDEEGYYVLESSLATDEMIKIVKNIKILK